MRSASTSVLRQSIIAAVVALISTSGASNAVEPVDLVLVASTAAQSSEIANRILVSAYSETSDTDSLQTLQELGSRAVTLLAEIEDESLAGTPLSGTRDRFLSVSRLVSLAREVIDEGHIHVDPVDETQLTQLLSVLDRQYSPRSTAGIPLP